MNDMAGQRRSRSGGAVPVLAPYYRPALSKKAVRRLYWLLFFSCFITGGIIAIFPPSWLSMLLYPIAIQILLVIWLLPETENPPLRLMNWTFFAFFISVIIWPYYLAIQIPGMPLIEIRRTFVSLSLLSLMISYSVSPTFRMEIGKIYTTIPLLGKFFAFYLLTQLLSIVLAPNVGQSFSVLAKNLTSGTGVFLIGMFVLTREGRAEKLVGIFCGLGMFISLLGFAEYRNQQVLWANHIPQFLMIQDPVMQNLLTPVFRNGFYRVTGTFSVSLVYAEFQSLTMPFLLHYFLFGKRPFWRFVCVVADGLAFAAILLTQARVGIAGAIVAHAVYIAIWAIKRRREDKQTLIGTATLFGYPMVVALIGLAVMVVPAVHNRVLGGGTHQASSDARKQQWNEGIPLIAKRPLFGYGPSQAAGVLGYTNPAGVITIDSGILVTLLNYGLVGFISYIGMLAMAIIEGIRVGTNSLSREVAYAAPAAVALMVWLNARLVLAQEDTYPLMYVFLGLIVALVYRERMNAASGPVSSAS